MSTNKTALARKELETEQSPSSESSNENCNRLILEAHNGIKANKQARERLESLLASAVSACYNHAKSYGDVMPMDRLVKPLVKGDTYEQMLGIEIVSWLRRNSPIRWNAKGNPGLVKEGENGYKPFEDDIESQEPFHATAEAQAARKAARNASARSLKPVSISDLRTRVYGIEKWFESMGKPNASGETRGYVKGEKARMQLVINGIKASFDRMIGEEAAKTEKEIEEKTAKVA